MNTDRAVPRTARSRSQSAKTSAAFFLPSSNEIGVSAGAAAAMIAEPVVASPVQVIASTPGWPLRNSPAEPGPKPCTTL